jgi:hypothetical protein
MVPHRGEVAGAADLPAEYQRLVQIGCSVGRFPSRGRASRPPRHRLHLVGAGER